MVWGFSRRRAAVSGQELLWNSEFGFWTWFRLCQSPDADWLTRTKSGVPCNTTTRPLSLSLSLSRYALSRMKKTHPYCRCGDAAVRARRGARGRPRRNERRKEKTFFRQKSLSGRKRARLFARAPGDFSKQKKKNAESASVCVDGVVVGFDGVGGPLSRFVGRSERGVR